MTWEQELVALYDANEHLAGVVSGTAPVLAPVAHLPLKANIEVVVDEDGNFVSATRTEKGQDSTLVPATIASGSRTNGIAPMALHDKLIYVAGDYEDFESSMKGAKKNGRDYYKAYMGQLGKWSEDENSPACLRPVYTYLAKKSLIRDLMKEDVFEKEGDFVRFSVVERSGEINRLFENPAVSRSWTAYYVGTLEGEGIDMMTGEQGAIADKHSSGIRFPGDAAKLISSQDDRAFTYRGRFRTAEEAASVGYVSSQKMHKLQTVSER